jgi:hypothetical protein
MVKLTVKAMDDVVDEEDSDRPSKIVKKPALKLRKRPESLGDDDLELDDELDVSESAPKRRPRTVNKPVTLPDIRLEELKVTETELWDQLKTRPGDLKNWMTKNRPHFGQCARAGVLSQLVLSFNDIIEHKLNEWRKKNSPP